MEEALDYTENLYSDYYQNQDNKTLEETRALALAKLKTAHNSDYAKCLDELLEYLEADKKSAVGRTITKIFDKHFT